MKKNAELAIVIPHYNGFQILHDCLESLFKTQYTNYNVYVIDNNSTDTSIAEVKSIFTDERLTIISLEENLGYAGGCNYGYEHSTEEFVLFLNNDTIHEPEWLAELVQPMKDDAEIGAIQPKIRSYYNRELFDYSGACGGELDKFGYPFARGRIFEDIEEDMGQYDSLPKEIFWASGTAMLVRREAMNEFGAFDSDFFAHMEEIDLSWRLQRFGWKICVAQKSVIYHHSGYTLDKMNPLKMYLNHRNNLLMMYKNLEGNSGKRILRKRYIFEGVTLIYALVSLDFKRFSAVFRGFKDYLKMRKNFTEKRDQLAQAAKSSPSNFYNRSIVTDYFIQKKKKFSDLVFFK